MDSSSPRWHEVNASDHPHERRALDHVRQLLPDRQPFQAWTNFTFSSGKGRLHEVDLLVATPDGLHLIEIKNYKGRLTNDGDFWSHGGRSYKNPLILTDLKAKELKSYLELEARRVDLRMRVPFLQASVFLAEPHLVSELDHYQRNSIYAPADAVNDLPRVGRDLLLARSRYPAPDPDFLDALPGLLRKVGIADTLPSRAVGPWVLDAEPYEEGATWWDFHATRHDIAGRPHRRIRIYLKHQHQKAAARDSVQHVAEREFQAAQGIKHPGILVPTDLDEHELGPALIIDQEPDARRLDEWLVEHRAGLGLPQRLDLIRQIAEAVAHAHAHRLVHRALSPRAVIVERGPQVRIGEWQVAARGLSSSKSPHRVAPTAMAMGHLDPTTDGFLAPELSREADGTVDIDVFGVGALAYLILTGRAPARTKAELIERLTRDKGLDPHTGISALDHLVLDATRPDVGERTVDVAELLEELENVEVSLRTRGRGGDDPDPIAAQVGDVLPGGYRVDGILGEGTSARALLVRRDGLKSVLKIGSTADAERLLVAEAAALEDVRHDHLVALRRAPFSLGSRHAIELTYAGARTLGDLLRADGPLRGEALRAYGDQLLEAVAYLEQHHAVHRDIKPSNVGVREDGPRGPRLILFDFSLSRAASTDIVSGSEGYRDPHLGTAARPAYDAAADLYALAATLHQMATIEIPQWSTDGTDPRFVDEATLAEHALDPEHRGALAAFFRTALHKDASRRHGSADRMRRAWNAVFAAPAPTHHEPEVTALDVHVEVLRSLRARAPEERQQLVAAIAAAAKPAPRLSAPPGARDLRMRTMAITDDVAGVVVLALDGRGLLLKVLPTDEAAAWARSHTASVNEVTGAVELRDAVGLDRIERELELLGGTDTERLFADVTDDDLRELGLDARVISFARAITTVTALENAQPILPDEQYGVLHALASGQAVEEVRATLVVSPADHRTRRPLRPRRRGPADGRQDPDPGGPRRSRGVPAATDRALADVPPPVAVLGGLPHVVLGQRPGDRRPRNGQDGRRAASRQAPRGEHLGRAGPHPADDLHEDVGVRSRARPPADARGRRGRGRSGRQHQQARVPVRPRGPRTVAHRLRPRRRPALEGGRRGVGRHGDPDLPGGRVGAGRARPGHRGRGELRGLRPPRTRPRASP